MKKFLFACVASIGITLGAVPGHPGFHHPPPHHHVHHLGPRVRHVPPPPHHHHHHCHPGPIFVGGLVGGLIGSAVVEAIRPTPTVVVQQPAVQTPVVIQTPVPTQVWVEGRYVQQIVNGVVTSVWQPGHWETVYR